MGGKFLAYLAAVTSVLACSKADPVADVAPLLGGRYLFGQQLTYCHDASGHFVTDGCAASALGILCAYNRYPALTVDHEPLDYDRCDVQDGTGLMYQFSDNTLYIRPEDYFTDSGQIPALLSRADKRLLLQKIDPAIFDRQGEAQVYDGMPFYRSRFKLTSALFYLIDPVVKGWSATGATPLEVESALRKLQYADVRSVWSRGLSEEQTHIMARMLGRGLPVLLCGWSLFDLPHSHFWVVDGIRTNGGEVLLHCNWGHNDRANGWFRPEDLRQEPPAEAEGKGRAWNNLIVYTYGLSAPVPGVDIHEFSDKHRASYAP